MIKTLTINSRGQRLIEITREIQAVISESNLSEGLCTVFIRHTSASLVIQENADPSVQDDLLHWLSKAVPEGDSAYTHTSEGLDDMPAHIKSMITGVQVAVPFSNKKLLLGTWQGIYLCEHRYGSHQRQVVVHIGP